MKCTPELENKIRRSIVWTLMWAFKGGIIFLLITETAVMLTICAFFTITVVIMLFIART